MGVFSVTKNVEGYMLHFNGKESAESCQHFLFQFGIFSSKGQAQPKTIRPLEKSLGILLVEKEYQIIAGVIKNCPCDVTKIKTLAVVHQFNNHATASNKSKTASTTKQTLTNCKSNHP